MPSKVSQILHMNCSLLVLRSTAQPVQLYNLFCSSGGSVPKTENNPDAVIRLSQSITECLHYEVGFGGGEHLPDKEHLLL